MCNAPTLTAATEVSLSGFSKERLRELHRAIVFPRNVRLVTGASGGRRMNFSVAVVAGDRKGRVGVGLGKAGEVSEAIKKGGELGKRLDFLIQELHREANTLGSKSAALELTNISVEMKVAIEQLREQVQNIE